MSQATSEISRGVSRRHALATGAGAVAVGFGLAAGPARAGNDYAEQIRKFTGGKQPVEGFRERCLAGDWPPEQCDDLVYRLG